MKKNYTIFFSIDEFENSKENIFEVDDIIASNAVELKELSKMFEKIEVSPKQETIDKILNFARNL